MSFINDLLNAPQALGNQAASAYDSALAAANAREAAAIVAPVVETVAPAPAPMNPAKVGLATAGVVGAIGLIGYVLSRR